METVNVQIIRGIVLIILISYLLVLSYITIKLQTQKNNILKDQSVWIIWCIFNLPFIFITSFLEWESFLSKEIIAIWVYSSLLYVSIVVLLTLYGKFYYFWKARK